MNLETGDPHGSSDTHLFRSPTVDRVEVDGLPRWRGWSVDSLPFCLGSQEFFLISSVVENCLDPDLTRVTRSITRWGID